MVHPRSDRWLEGAASNNAGRTSPLFGRPSQSWGCYAARRCWQRVDWARSMWSRSNVDTGGEFAITLGSPPQGLEVGASRFCSWSAGPPRVHPDQIDCDGGGYMLQACLRDPDIAASPQSAATDRLFMCSLNACACGVALADRTNFLRGGRPLLPHGPPVLWYLFSWRNLHRRVNADSV